MRGILRVVAEVNSLLSRFAQRCQRALATGLGEAEEQLRSPLIELLEALGDLIGVPCVLVGETALLEERSRPDFAVLTDTPLPVGFIELGPGPLRDARFERSHLRVGDVCGGPTVYTALGEGYHTDWLRFGAPGASEKPL